MSIIQALVLGIVQGLTEFLPVSSSGHLIFVPFLFGWDEPSLAFSVAVHLGTLIALLNVFWDDVRILTDTALHWKTASESNRLVLRLLAYGTVPAVVVGLAVEPFFEEQLARPMLVVVMFGVIAYYMSSTETRATAEPRGGDALTTRDAWGIGIAQAVAILPGISRSGATVATGMRLGLSRAAAARFSFMLAIPVVAGAVVVQVPSMLSEGLSGSGPAMIIGVVSAAVSGRWAINFFLALVQRKSLRVFSVYLSFVVVAGLLTGLARG